MKLVDSDEYMFGYMLAAEIKENKIGDSTNSKRFYDALKMIWRDDSYFNARSMDVYIAKLRKYLKGDPSVEILTVHGEGFKLIQATPSA